MVEYHSIENIIQEKLEFIYSKNLYLIRGSDFLFDMNIELDIYSGSFEVLVDLVKEKKLPVRKIPVSKIADIFTAYVKDNKNDLANIGEFMKLAAYLTYLKSKELLPRAEYDDEFKRQRNFLYSIIEDYDLIKQTSQLIKEDFGKPKSKTIQVKTKSAITKDTFEEQISSIFMDYITLQEKLEIVRELYSIESCVKMLEEYNSFDLNHIYKLSGGQKLKFVVLFLALLTMLNENKVHFTDEGTFERLEI